MGGGLEPRDTAFRSYLSRTGEARERSLGENGAQEGQTTNQQGAPERPRCKKAGSLPMKWGGGGDTRKETRDTEMSSLRGREPQDRTEATGTRRE